MKADIHPSMEIRRKFVNVNVEALMLMDRPQENKCSDLSHVYRTKKNKGRAKKKQLQNSFASSSRIACPTSFILTQSISTPLSRTACRTRRRDYASMASLMIIFTRVAASKPRAVASSVTLVSRAPSIPTLASGVGSNAGAKAGVIVLHEPSS